jgi:hypothetical protein
LHIGGVRGRMDGGFRGIGGIGGRIWCGDVGRWRLYVVGFTNGQIIDLPYGFYRSCLRKRSQIGLPLFVETLEFVERAR